MSPRVCCRRAPLAAHSDNGLFGLYTTCRNTGIGNTTTPSVQGMKWLRCFILQAWFSWTLGFMALHKLASLSGAEKKLWGFGPHRECTEWRQNSFCLAPCRTFDELEWAGRGSFLFLSAGTRWLPSKHKKEPSLSKTFSLLLKAEQNLVIARVSQGMCVASLHNDLFYSLRVYTQFIRPTNVARPLR